MCIRNAALPALAWIVVVTTACGEIGPTAVETLPAGEPSFAQVPGELTAGQTPDAGAQTAEFPNTFVCGIEVTTTVHFAGAVWPVPVGPAIREAGRSVLAWTNEENGRSIASEIGGQVTREIVAFFPDGSFRVHEVFTHGVRLVPENGPVVALSAGRLVLEFTVVPLAGDFVLTDWETLFVGGPRDDANLLQSPEFCAVVEDALL